MSTPTTASVRADDLTIDEAIAMAQNHREFKDLVRNPLRGDAGAYFAEGRRINAARNAIIEAAAARVAADKAAAHALGLPIVSDARRAEIAARRLARMAAR